MCSPRFRLSLSVSMMRGEKYVDAQQSQREKERGGTKGSEPGASRSRYGPCLERGPPPQNFPPNASDLYGKRRNSFDVKYFVGQII